LRGENAAGAGPILDYHRLLPRLAQFAGDQARVNVGLAARCKADDDADRARRVITRLIFLLGAG
jgi:hypothetical protein